MAFRTGLAMIVALAFTSCGGKTAPTAPASTSAAALTVTIVPAARTLTTAAFTPNPATLAPGGKLTWSNTDTTTHDMISDSGLWDSGRINPGDHFDFNFQTKGTFPYHCSIHPGMVGTVVVQ